MCWVNSGRGAERFLLAKKTEKEIMGEFDLIAKYFTRPAPKAVIGVGDDCAVIAPSPGLHLCVSSDMLVEGRHFLSTVDPYRLGVKALAVNLSDLAACGATPRAFTLSLALPGVDAAWLEAFSEGLWDTALENALDLVGGDTTKGPLCISITAFGEVPPGDALLRSGAQVGDDIYVSGTLGDAALALEVFRGNVQLEGQAFERVRARMELPTPRVALGCALRGVANACIDVSDGLLGDLNHILQRSGVGGIVTTQWITESAALSLDMSEQPLAKRMEFVLSGGDDYELLFTASPDMREEVALASEQSKTGVTRIGEITQNTGLKVLDLDGEVIKRRFSSFDHFQHNY